MGETFKGRYRGDTDVELGLEPGLELGLEPGLLHRAPQADQHTLVRVRLKVRVRVRVS